ncbi:hypothetical protein BKA63DRAFT_198822 [Paraphoma chrysanthemicola]|nr:hypothetical protein BKA63DRAFT_198822 [Paraphoma chrysanthemicola]
MTGDMLDISRSQFFPPCSLYVALSGAAVQKKLLKDWLNGTHDRFIYFVVEKDKHYSSVQIHIKAFQLEEHPEQWFCSAFAKYKLCCRDAKVEDFDNEVRTTAQTIHGSFTFPTWNFSTDHCWKLEFNGAPFINSTTCLAATIESLKQCLPHDIRQSDPNVTSVAIIIGESYRKRVEKALDQIHEAVERPRLSTQRTRKEDNFRSSSLGLPAHSNNFCSPEKSVHNGADSQDEYTEYLDPIDVLTSAKQLNEVEEIIKKLISLESHATKITNFSKYLSTSILLLHTSQLKLKAKKNQRALVRGPHYPHYSSNF